MMHTLNWWMVVHDVHQVQTNRLHWVVSIGSTFLFEEHKKNTNRATLQIVDVNIITLVVILITIDSHSVVVHYDSLIL